MNSSLTALNRSIKDYDAQIAEETRRLEAHTQAKRDEINRRLEAAKEAVTVADSRNKEVIEKKRNKVNEQAEIKGKGQAAENQKNQLQERITECQTMITRCKEQEKNSLATYGHDIKGILQSISKMRWHGETPIGPLGMYVKLKDRNWAPLLRAQLGSLMTSFACTDARDRQQLKRLFDQSKKCVLLLVSLGCMILMRGPASMSTSSSPNGIYSIIVAESPAGMCSLFCAHLT
jgi:chromosome segregation ATPase